MQCVFCEATTNLNTKMHIKLDDQSVVDVLVCDDHAEDATVKSVREAHLNKLQKIEELKKLAKQLGLEVTESTASPILIAAAPVAATPIQQPVTPQPVAQDTQVHDQDMIDSDIIDKRLTRTIHSVGGTVVGGMKVESHQQHELSVDSSLAAARKGKVKMELVEGRAGSKIAIPTKRVDGTGITNINISNEENDVKLQSRFKRKAQMTMNDTYHNERYLMRDCPACKGIGILTSRGVESVCNKCGGSGMISII